LKKKYNNLTFTRKNNKLEMLSPRIHLKLQSKNIYTNYIL